MKSLSLLTLVLVSLLPYSYALNGDPALKLYFTFDEGQGNTVTDHSTSQLQGKMTGKVKFIKDGKYKSAVSLGDPNSLIKVPAAPELDITKAITMEAWIFPQENQNDSNVMGRRTTANAGGYCIQWSGFGNAAKVETWIGLPGWKGTRKVQKIEPKLEQWHHVAATYDGKEIKQYVNGQLDALVEAPAKEIASQKVEFHIGKSQTGLPGMVGKIDEVAIYNRALTADEILSDMKGVLTLTPVDPKEKLATIWANLKR